MPAATLTVRHRLVGRAAGRAGRAGGAPTPPRSATAGRSCSRWPARPTRSVIHWPGAEKSARWSSVTRTRQPSRRRSGDRRVPAERDEHAALRSAALAAAAAWSAASALAVAPRSSVTPRERGTVPAAWSTVDRPPAGNQGDTDGRYCRAALELVEVAVVAQGDQRAADRRVDVPVGERAARSAASTASSSSGLTVTGRAGGRVQRGQLGVVAKPRACRVEPRDDLLDGLARGASAAGSLTATTAVLPSAPKLTDVSTSLMTLPVGA